MPPACAATSRECPSSTIAMARMRRACLASAVRAASARNCEILKSWCVISIADMLPAPRINDMLHRVTVAGVWESPQESGSQAAGMRSVGSDLHEAHKSLGELIVKRGGANYFQATFGAFPVLSPLALKSPRPA